MSIALAASSGLTGLASDLREFVAAVHFTRVEALWLLLVLPALGLLDRWAARCRRSTTAQIGRPAAVAGQLTHPVERRRWLGVAYPLAWASLILALAGPHWGKSDEAGVAVGRDVVIVLDLSRSMQADDVNLPPRGWTISDAAEQREPKRWLAAREWALDMLSGIRQRGGHRVAVVVFAAHPKVLCPLTSDYDHVQSVLEDVDGQHPPPECRPGLTEEISGTRIGSALIEAVNAHDKRFPGFQDIVLLSDGDDPAEDKEWLLGSTKARENDIPVHTVGIGNPEAGGIILLGNELQSTRLKEEPLKQIARETRGIYIPARTNSPQLGEFFRSQLEPLPSRSVSDDSAPLPHERYAWFLGPALILFLIGWLRNR